MPDVLRYLALGCLLTGSFALKAQELVMNGSFEEENICTEYIKNCAPEAWISTSLTSDHYFDDPPHAFDGQHFIGLVVPEVYSRRPNQYIRSRLLCGLRKDAQYRLEFYVRSTHDDVDSVGVYFSSDDVLLRRQRLKEVTPQLWVGTALASRKTTTWQKVSFTYTASGNEQFICIGSFKRTGHRYLGAPDLGRDFYYFIDLVSLRPVNPNEKLCAEAEKVKQQEYEFDYRHHLLEKYIYVNSRKPPAPDTPSLTILQRVDTFVIPDVLFATNSFDLTADATQLLDSFLIRTSRLHIDSVVVEGHTDSTGTVEHNQELSENRAQSVATYLQTRMTVTFYSRGLASRKPVAGNRTPAGRQRNRRVEIYVYVKEN